MRNPTPNWGERRSDFARTITAELRPATFCGQWVKYVKFLPPSCKKIFFHVQSLLSAPFKGEKIPCYALGKGRLFQVFVQPVREITAGDF